ncbi:MAG: hypothetical protein U0T74_01705 [Chitinophagales bacterium]
MKLLDTALLAVSLLFMILVAVASYYLQERYLEKRELNKAVTQYDDRLKIQEQMLPQKLFTTIAISQKCACLENDNLVLKFYADSSAFDNVSLIYLFKLLRCMNKTVEKTVRQDVFTYVTIKMQGSHPFYMNFKFLRNGDSVYLIEVTNFCQLLKIIGNSPKSVVISHN